ncbi:MAG TPA: membrane dipeptidase [Thermohalobaculum sp.]|nr:membrane dipeptidase [Thermohalobaculum sp.]
MLTVGLVAALAIGAAWGMAGRYSDLLAKNRVLQAPPPCQSDPACLRYREFFIADAHSDTLLHRDPAEPSVRGHVDLSRLLRGGINLQVFAMAPVAPRMQAQDGEVCGSREAANRIAQLFAVNEPLRPSTWISDEARVRRMMDRFDAAMVSRPSAPGRFIPIRDAADAARLLSARERGEAVVGALLSVEGFYWASPDRDELQRQLQEMQRRGVRMIGLTQRASGPLAGSSEDCGDRGGLTEAGRFAVREIWRQGMVLDLAHASPAAIADVAEMAKGGALGAVVVSHTGLQRACDRDRNLSDADARNVARAGGVIGLGYWRYVACWSPDDSPSEIRRKLVESFVALHDILDDPDFRAEMGPDYSPMAHIGLGSDFDGGTTMPFDTTGIPWLLAGLAAAERDGRRIFEDADIERIAGGNYLRLLESALE